MKVLNFCLFIVTYFELSESARILGVVTQPSYSHQITYKAIWKGLLERGHELVLLTTNPFKDQTLKNLKEIDLSFAYSLNDVLRGSSIPKSDNIFNFIFQFIHVRNEVLTQELLHPEVQALIRNKSEHFDLVMAEFILPPVAAFAHRFNAPLIAMFPGDNSYVHKLVGGFNHYTLYPEAMFPFTGKLNFFQRLSSFFMFSIYPIIGFFACPVYEKVIKTVFGDDYPNIYELEKMVDMVFAYTTPSLHKVRPTVPAFVSIGGGIHLQEPKPLPKDLEEFLQKSKNGVIYFSLGSNVQSKDLDKRTRSILMETFTELPYDILWKFENEELKGKPKNVVIRKWLPQQDLLRNSKVKLFITQGGIQSIEESMYNHMPMVGIPFVGDQKYNIKNIEHRGMGIYVDYKTMSKDSLKEAILEVINNPMYKENTKKLAELTLDQPMSGLEKAIWWSEYVIRHKGAKHLKGPAVDMPYYQYFLLDVIGFCLAILFVIFYIFIRIFKFIFSLCGIKRFKKEKKN